MMLHVRWKNLEVSQSIREHAERTVGGALVRFRDRVASVRIDLADVAYQPGHGGEKVCRIQVRGDSACEVIVTDTDRDLYVAIHRAAGRAQQSMASLLDR